MRNCLQAVAERGVEDLCDFKVLQKGKWYVFEGCVDSQATKTELLDMAPEIDGASWVVDKLRIVGRPASATEREGRRR
jgi:hypothetical protein